MAYTAPRTWVTGEVLTAALLNTHLRDNMLETAVAKSTAAGDTTYATAANTLARLALGNAGQMLKVNSSTTAPFWGQFTHVTAARTAETAADTVTTTSAASLVSQTVTVNHTGTLYALGWSYGGRTGGDGNTRWQLYVDVDDTTGTPFFQNSDYSGVGVCVGSAAVSSGTKTVVLYGSKYSTAGDNVSFTAKGLLAFAVSS